MKSRAQYRLDTHRRMVAAFCPTGKGGGLDNSCASTARQTVDSMGDKIAEINSKPLPKRGSKERIELAQHLGKMENERGEISRRWSLEDADIFRTGDKSKIDQHDRLGKKLTKTFLELDKLRAKVGVD